MPGFLQSEMEGRETSNPLFTVIPAPYEESVSYGGGTARGPEAILAASQQLESWDGLSEPIELGIATAEAVDCRGGVQEVLERIEGAVGQDDHQPMGSGLVQADWLHPGRRWGAASQYSYFNRGGTEFHAVDERATCVLTRYFRNDIGNATLHWIALALEERLRAPEDGEDTLLALQYYRYW